MLSGWKTYITGAAMILSGAGLVLKDLAEKQGFNEVGFMTFMSGFGFIFNRAGMKKEIEKIQ
mgnify:CR=1 FL=1